MGMIQQPIIPFVHAVIILAVSFFVLLAGSKSDSPRLKAFGYVIAVLLWGCAALIFGSGIDKRNCPKGYPGSPDMGGRMENTMPKSDKAPQQMNREMPGR